MASLSNLPTLSNIDLYSSDTTVPSGYYVGMYQIGANGKGFRYARAGAANLVVGNVIQSSAIDAQFDDMAVPATSAATVAGATGNIVITNGTTTVIADAWIGSTLVVSVTPGLGEEYTILDNTAATSGTALGLVLDRPIRTAWTTSTKVTLRKSPWLDVIQAPVTTLTGSIAGVAIYPIPATQYGWVQTKGVAGVLSDGTSIIAGSDVMGVSPTTAGKMSLTTAGKPHIGYAMRAAADGKCIPVMLNID